MRLCPASDRCRLCPAKYDRRGRKLKYNCYNEKDPRCPLAMIDAALGAARLISDLARARWRAWRRGR